MSVNYEAIQLANIEEYGKGTRHLAYLSDLYSTRTHFIFELLQNTEDAIARSGSQDHGGFAEFRLYSDRLELRHNGKPFDEDDIRGICGIGEGTKAGDFGQIGKFGVGFKAVYSYTLAPQIHSGQEHFRIHRFVEPHHIDVEAGHAEITNKNETLIVLPFDSEELIGFRERVPPEVAVNEIGKALKGLHPRSLLFLRHIREVRWILPGGESGSVRRRSRSISDNRAARVVNLLFGRQRERWLVFEQETKIEDFKRQKTRIEVAFQMEGRCVVRAQDTELVVFFPTKVRTDLGILIQAPFKTKVTRENLDEDCVENKWLLMAAAKLASEGLEFLRDLGRIALQSYAALPIVASDFQPESFCRPVFDEIKCAIKTRNLLPSHSDAEDDPKFICGDQAVAASDPELRELLTNDELNEALGGDTDWRWLAEDMSLDGDGALAVYLRDEIEILEFTAEDFVSWLETKDTDWWKALDEPCLLSAYRYLHSQPSEQKRLRKLPLVRLENGEHVSPDDQAVFFPADNIHQKKELTPFLAQLPIIRLSLLDDDEDKTVESFLRRIGVARLVASEFIKHYFVPHFKDGSKHTVADVVALGRYLFSAFQRMDVEERQATVAQVSQVHWLLCRTKAKPEANYLNAPSNVYIGSKYTDLPFLDDYFSASPDKYFVNECYHEAMEDWLTFLETLGCASTPRKIEDGHGIDGLAAILAKLSQAEGEECLDLACTIFDTLSATISEVEYDRKNWGIVTNRVWITRRGPGSGDWLNRPEPARFIASLKTTAWLPQISGVLCRPGDLFENTEQNRRVLGDLVCYLHGKINPASDQQKWLAKELGIQARPTKDSILRVLRLLKEAEGHLAEVVPLYNALAQFGADVAEEFEKNELVFCPDSEAKWRPQSKVFWNDESPVFGFARGYLKQVYPDLQSFFLNIGVPPNASPADYAKALLEIAKSKAADETSKIRIHRIYRRLSPRFDEGGDWLEDETWENYWGQLMTGQFWLGRKGEDFGFYPLSELVVVDNEHLENLFHGKVAFWPFKDLNDFAKEHLKVETCSSAEQDFQIESKGERQDALSEQLASIWPSIGEFLQSDKWRHDVVDDREFTDTPPLIRAAGKIAVIYTLKEVKAEEPDGKTAFFDATENTVWLVPCDANEGDEHFEALSEALQEHYGPEPLREFVYDLFRKGIEKAEVEWRKRGLMSRRDVPAETQPADSDPGSSRGNLTATGASTASSAEKKGEDTGPFGNAAKSSGAAVAPATHVNPDTKGEKPAPFRDKLNDTLNKPGKVPEPVQAPEKSPVSNPERRREQTEKEIAAAREKEPRQSERQKTLPRTVWESKNSAVRSKLKEWYSGKCQICSDTFCKRDGENYFEACYLVPRTAEGAAWLDRVGNVLCLCADCSAKFQFGPIESPSDIQEKIAYLKLVKEGGSQPHIVSLKLCGENALITFDERHLIDLQSMLNSDQSRITSARQEETTQKTRNPTPNLVQCPHCASKVRADRLQKHIKSKHSTDQSTQSKVSQIPPETPTRRCRTGCGRTAMQGTEHCEKHM